MRRVFAIAVLGALALLPISAQAQRMGGRGMVGGGVGVRGPAVGMRGPAVGARGPAVGMRGPVVAPGRMGPVFSRGRVMPVRTVSPSGRVIVNGGFAFHTPFGFHGHCFNGFPCHHHFFFNNPFFFNPFFNPFFFGAGFGFGAPFFGPSYIPGFDTGYYPPAQQPVVVSQTDTSSDIQLALQMQRLTDEVESMREEQRRQAAPPPGASLSPRQPAVPTTFVFRDGHRVSTQNYAIAGQTLWILTEHTARKVAIADLDRAATEQANSANGIELRIPEPPTR